MAFGGSGGGSGTVSGSSDVLLSVPATNDALLYSQPIQKWVNAPAVTPAQLTAVGDTKAPIATTMVVVNHGSAANTIRPAGAPAVYWIGSVAPTNMTNADIYNGPAV